MHLLALGLIVAVVVIVILAIAHKRHTSLATVVESAGPVATQDAVVIGDHVETAAAAVVADVAQVV